MKNTKELEKQYINKMEKIHKKYNHDNETLHILYDNCLLCFLKEIGYNDLANQYKKIQTENIFWYS